MEADRESERKTREAAAQRAKYRLPDSHVWNWATARVCNLLLLQMQALMDAEDGGTG